MLTVDRVKLRSAFIATRCERLGGHRPVDGRCGQTRERKHTSTDVSHVVPPVEVYREYGLSKTFFLNVTLTCLGLFPGDSRGFLVA